MYCTKCGKQIGDYDTICNGCGEANIAVKELPKPRKDQYESPVLCTISLILAIFFPIIGIPFSVFAGLKYRSSKMSNVCIRNTIISIIVFVAEMFVFALLLPLFQESISTLLTGFYTQIVEKFFSSPMITNTVNSVVGVFAQIAAFLEKILVPIAKWLN